MVEMLTQLTVSGLAMGGIYALMAMGLLLLIRAIGVLNFAQGDLFMVGAFFGWALTYQAKLPLPFVWLFMLLSFFVMAVIFMFGVYWPHRNTSWPTAIIICTVGASTIYKEAVKLIWGANPIAFAPLLEGSITIGAANLGLQYLLVIGVSIVFIAGVFILFEKFYAGRVMQAAAQDKYVAEIMGIPTILTTLATYIIVMVIAGTGGYLIAPAFYASVNLANFQARAFAGVVIGGWGSLKGSVIGSLIVGLIESFSSIVTTTYKDAIVFLVLLIVLIVRPQGLFGTNISDKA